MDNVFLILPHFLCKKREGEKKEDLTTRDPRVTAKNDFITSH